jgi:T5SS/PEP-CTERM-associated repeat protein
MIRLFVCGIVLCLGSGVFAVDDSWTSLVSGFWQTAGNWSAGAPSNNFSTVWIANSSSKTVTIDATTTNFPTTLTVSNLVVTGGSGFTNTLLLSNAGQAVPLRVLNSLTVTSNAVLIVTNSSLRIEGAVNSILDGVATLQAGAVVVQTSTFGLIGIGNYQPFASLTIAGGVLSNGNGYIGTNPGANSNTVTVTGAGSIWNNSSYLNVGYNGFGNSLTITNGGAVYNSGYGYIGVFSGSNTVTVAGSGSRWNNASYLYVGGSGSGNSLTISNGGVVSYSSVCYIGYNAAASSNTVTVTGAGSAWTGSGNFFIGYYGSNNALTIASGSSVTNGHSYIGLFAGANANAVTVIGAGSTWNNNGSLTIGNNSLYNTMTISNGGKVFNDYGYIGSYSGGNSNNVLVTGGGSTWSNRFDLFVGDSGRSNTLMIASGGTVYSAYGYIGYNGGANSNLVVVTGAGSVWTNRSYLYVGYYASGNALTISNGGVVYNNSGAIIGVQLGANYNIATVSGPGSVWDAGITPCYVGYNGSGNTLVVTNGGAMYNGHGYIGYFPSALSNAVNVTGAGSVWSNRNELRVGDYGTASALTIANSGVVFNANGYIGYQTSASNSTATVTGSRSVWNNATNLYVGVYSTGNALTISDGGAVLAQGVYVAANPGSSGTLTLNGGSLIASNLLINTAGVFNYNTGTLQLSGTLTLNGGTLNLGRSLVVGSGGMSASAVLLSGTVGILPTGALRLGADITSVGADVINQGVLQVLATTFAFNGGFENDANFVVANNQFISVLGGLANSGGFIIQPGAVVSADSMPFQTGSLYLYSGSLLSVGSAWNNAGPISIQGGGISGGAINNAALIEGYGAVSAPLVNQDGGTVRASGGLLSLNGSSIQNQAGGSFEIENGATLRVGRNFNNAGDINNFGGILDVSGFILTNASVLGGSGTFKAAQTVNAGRVLFQGGQADIYGVYLNTAGATTTVYQITANFHGTFTNAAGAYFKNTGSQVTFFGPTSIGGTYLSDPAMNVFNSALNVSGVLAGGAGDVFVFNGDFTSTNPDGLQLAGAKVVFNAGAHTFTLSGTASIGELELQSGASILLAGGDLIVGLLNADTNQFTTAQTIYYDPAQNPSLGAQTYALNGGGSLTAVPEPSSALLVVLGLALLMRSVVRGGRV